MLEAHFSRSQVGGASVAYAVKDVDLAAPRKNTRTHTRTHASVMDMIQ